MGRIRDLTEHENELCRALGEVVIFWNHVERSFRILLQRATHLGGSDGRIWSLVAHLTPVQLKDAMIALSGDHADDRRDHLIHCAKLFDREREYRNHFVHGPLTFLTTDASSSALVSTVTARGGDLSHRRAKIDAKEIMQFRDRLDDLQAYIGELIEDSHNLRRGQPLCDLERPKINPPLTIARQSWWKDAAN